MDTEGRCITLPKAIWEKFDKKRNKTGIPVSTQIRKILEGAKI
jgi:hypothetical protein